jgi:lysine decarboxylase
LPWQLDLPELPPLGGPLLDEGAVAASQRLVSQLFGSSQSWYGVNGASGLLQAALLGAAAPAGRVLLPRNHHRSLLHGCLLGNLEPIFYALPFDQASGLAQPLPPQWLKPLLDQAGSIDLLVLLSPTYQGQAAQLSELVAIAHSKGIPVLVDEAHGAHFNFAANLPEAGLASGADLVVQSLQKALGGLGQTALLHLQGDRLDRKKMELALLALQTSSPSALLLLSAEQAIARIASEAGQQQLQRCLKQAGQLRDGFKNMEIPLLHTQDPLRLVFHCARWGLTGSAADEWLMQNQIVAECPEALTLTFCLGLTPADSIRGQLSRGLIGLKRQQKNVKPLPPLDSPPYPPLGALAVPLGDAWHLGSIRLPLAEAAGRIAAETICPYPPGIPLLLPGERLDPARIDWLQQQKMLWGGQIADTVRVLA